MRSLTVAIFALALAAGLAAPAGNGTGNKLQDLFNAFIPFAAKASQKADPILLKDVSNLPIVTIIPPVGILLTAVNRTISGLSTFLVSNGVVENNTAQWRSTHPSLVMESDYQVKGLFYGKWMSGQGHATLTLSNVVSDISVTIRNAEVSSPLTNTTYSYLQIADLTQTLRVGNVSSNYTGLSVDGMSEDQVTKLLNTQVTTALNLNIPFWERIASETTKYRLNIALIGSTIDDAINWLKKNTPTSSMIQSLMADLHSL